jgi:hypothetical protein
MNDYELAIKRCKRLEELLEQGFGASGRGLHEKLTSVQSRLPQSLIKKMRYIATVRNRLVHETSVDRLDDKNGFETACNVAEQQLSDLLPKPKSNKPGCWFFLLALGSFVGAAVSAVVAMGWMWLQR